MQKVVDYKLVDAKYVPALQTAVTHAMKEGWVPSGTVVTFKDELIQAMVKFEAA
jgi:hypothetical protein